MCTSVCKICKVSLSLHTEFNEKSFAVKKYCHDCHVLFASMDCYKLHLSSHTCKNYPRCTLCQKRHEKNKKCNGTFYCQLCNKAYTSFPRAKKDIHECYIQPIKSVFEFAEKSFKIVFFDIETYVDQNSRQLVPNMICCQIFKVFVNKASHEYDRSVRFSKDNCLLDFINYFFPINPDNHMFSNTSFVSHNGSRFDNFFIFKAML